MSFKSLFDFEEALAKYTGVNIPMLHGPKREGDPAVLTADAGKFMSVCAWQPQFDLQDMITHAWAWYNQQ
jgi:UDP-glucose 4-epimerase